MFIKNNNKLLHVPWALKLFAIMENTLVALTEGCATRKDRIAALTENSALGNSLSYSAKRLSHDGK